MISMKDAISGAVTLNWYGLFDLPVRTVDLRRKLITDFQFDAATGRLTATTSYDLSAIEGITGNESFEELLAFFRGKEVDKLIFRTGDAHTQLQMLAADRRRRDGQGRIRAADDHAVAERELGGAAVDFETDARAERATGFHVTKGGYQRFFRQSAFFADRERMPDAEAMRGGDPEGDHHHARGQ